MSNVFKHRSKIVFYLLSLKKPESVEHSHLLGILSKNDFSGSFAYSRWSPVSSSKFVLISIQRRLILFFKLHHSCNNSTSFELKTLLKKSFCNLGMIRTSL